MKKENKRPWTAEKNCVD